MFSCVLEQVNFTDPSKLPLEFQFMLSSTHTIQKKCQKVLATGLGLEFQVYYYGSPYDQGQLTEVPLNFKILAIIVVGQTIKACSTTKMSKLQSNGIIKLGLVKSLDLYCNLIPHKSQKSKLKLVTGFQINFLCIDPDQVNHLKDLRGGIMEFEDFTCPSTCNLH